MKIKVLFNVIVVLVIFNLFFTLLFHMTNEDKIKIIKDSCSEIDEICEKDFIEMCRLSIPEIIGIDTDTWCDRIFEARCEDEDCYCNDNYGID